MIEVYSDKKIFEHIVLYQEKNPNWYEIFCNYADICLNISDADLKIEEQEGTPIFEYIKANGGTSPIALDSYFTSIEKDSSIIQEKPFSVFFFDKPKADTEKLQKDYGVLVISKETILDSILTASYYRDLSKGEVCEDNELIGWHELLKIELPPSNSAVLLDNYIFKNSEKGKNVGIANLIQLFDSLLPQNLSIPYHITIISEHHDYSQTWQDDIRKELIEAITKLRTYVFEIELLFQESEEYHKRFLITNYTNGSCDKGFGMFKVECGKTVRAKNDLRINMLFNNIQNLLGDTEYDSIHKTLNTIKKVNGKEKVWKNRLFNNVI